MSKKKPKDSERIAFLDKVSLAITLLYLHDILTDADNIKARRRFNKLLNPNSRKARR